MRNLRFFLLTEQLILGIGSQVLTYLTVSAVGAHLSANLSFDLLAIANAASTVGRVSSGLLADRYGAPSPPPLRYPSFSRTTAHILTWAIWRVAGPLNILVPAAVMTAVVTYAWPFATSVAHFVVISVFIGCVPPLLFPFPSPLPFRLLPIDPAR